MTAHPAPGRGSARGGPSSATARTLVALSMLLLVAAAAAGESPAADPAADVRRAIETVNARFSEAFVRGDAAAVAALYTEDAVLLPPGRMVRGREAIAEYFGPRPGRRQVAHSLTTEELRVDGATAVEIGTWSSTTQKPGEEEVTSSERYLLVWRRQEDGSWKIRVDMWHRP